MKVPNIKFHTNRSSASRVDMCGQKERQTDMVKLMVAFHDYANAPKKL
jgi:hypothetical protein